MYYDDSGNRIVKQTLTGLMLEDTVRLKTGIYRDGQ
jgi:hypothetical protein